MSKKRRDYRTVIFTSFKKGFSQLSRSHWYFSYASLFINQHIQEKLHGPFKANEFIADVLPVANFDRDKLLINPHEYAATCDENMNHLRTSLLVKACAIAEEYIHSYVKYWASANGYQGKKKNSLSRVGESVIAPAMVSNLQSALGYIAELFPLTFQRLDLCGKAYKLRCTIAHNGDFIDIDIAKKHSEYKKQLGKPVIIDWSQLNSYLSAIYQACELIELSLPETTLSNIEALWLMQDYFDLNKDKSLSVRNARKEVMKIYNIHRFPDARQLAARLNMVHT